MRIEEGAIDRIIAIYKQKKPLFRGFVVSQGSINFEAVWIMLDGWSADHKVPEERADREEKKERKKEREKERKREIKRYFSSTRKARSESKARE